MSSADGCGEAARFIELCLAWEESQQFSRRSSVKKANRIFDQIKRSEHELAATADGRRRLIELLADSRAIVRFKAAVACLNFDPVAAQDALSRMAESDDPLYAFNAEMVLQQHQTGHGRNPSV